jgi:hypothetical protein
MQPVSLLLDFVGPKPVEVSGVSRAERYMVAIFGFLAALGAAAVWGVAAGTHDGHLALANAARVPLLLGASSLAALPIGLLTWKLTTTLGRGSDLVLGHAAATFTGALALAALAPVVVLYQESSVWAGPIVALGSAIVGAGVAFLALVRVVAKLVTTGSERRALLLPFALMFAVETATLMQLAALMPPILPERSAFGRGIDGIGDVSRDAQ